MRTLSLFFQILLLASLKFYLGMNCEKLNVQVVLLDTKILFSSIAISVFRYIYVGVLTVKSVEEAREMYQIGVKYGIPHISLLAKTYALRHLNPQNVWALLELAAKDDNAVAECCSVSALF